MSWSRASCSSVSRPQVSVPSPSRETRRPVRPRNLCCMGDTVSRPAGRDVLASPGERVRRLWRVRPLVQENPVLDFLQAAFLGVLQGLTEFLPISSSAHLRIFPELFGWGDPGAAFTAVVQIGTELAVLIYFRKDIWRIASAWVRSLFDPRWRGNLDARMGWFIIVGSLPIVLLGITLKDVIENDFRNLWIIGTTLIVLGVILGVADRVGKTDRTIRQMNIKHSVLLGLAQAMAL